MHGPPIEMFRFNGQTETQGGRYETVTMLNGGVFDQVVGISDLKCLKSISITLFNRESGRLFI